MKKIIILCLTLVMFCMSTIVLVGCKDAQIYTVVFMKDETELASKDYVVGEAPVDADYPIVEPKKGYDIVWEKPDYSAAKAKDRFVAKVKEVAKTYTISFDTDGGEALEAMTVTYDSPFILPTATKENMVFEYWTYTEEATPYKFYVSNEKWEFDKNITLKAFYSLAVHTVSYDLAASDATIDKMQTAVYYGRPYYLSVPSRPGYIFTGWKYNETAVDVSGSAWQYSSDITLIATWSEVTSGQEFTVIFDMEGEENDRTITLKQGEAPSEENLQGIPDLKNYAPTGYYGEWTLNGNVVGFYEVIYNKIQEIIDAGEYSVTLAPKFSPDVYNVKFVSDYGVAPEDTQVTYDQPYELQGVNYNKLVFDGWYYNGTKVELLGNWNIDADNGATITLEAKWKVKVTFVQDGRELGSKLYDPGASLNKDNVIDCENDVNDDNYWYWPNLSSYTNLNENITINAKLGSYWTENK